ncbi:MAG: 5'-nucleotidase C-terminal domain-containing protein [Roseobacter sp.]
MYCVECQEAEILDSQLPKLRVRLLATSDLHMQLLDFDYARDHPGETGSLAKIADLIKSARDGVDLCLLMDNGDTFQGTPVADFLARSPRACAHPMAKVMNQIGYDAIGLGNHDFDFGFAHLQQTLSALEAPAVCCNISGAPLEGLHKSVLLNRSITLSDGQTETLKIGITGAIPQMTQFWNRHHFEHSARLSPALEALRSETERLRADGADIIVVLAHMGITIHDEGDMPQNQIIEVANLPEVDAVIGGHTHLRFPGTDYEGTAGVDCRRGMIGQTPVVQPGPSGADFGQIDLVVTKGSDGWTVTAERVALRSSLPHAPESPAIVSLVREMHSLTRAYLSETVAHIGKPMNTFFALAQPSPVPAMMNCAKMTAVRRMIAANDDIAAALGHMPLLGAASVPATGGFDGPENFVAFSSGTLLRRHIVWLNRYANQVWAVKASGARIKEWLERSALIFNTLEAGKPDQLLVNALVPGFTFDTIYGLTYQIDPSRPPAYDLAGKRITGEAGRISDVRYQGKEIENDQEFLVATTDHRVGGGGAHAPFCDAEIMLRETAPLEEALMTYLQAPDCAAVHNTPSWRFPENMGIAALLNTAPAALDHLNDIAAFHPQTCGVTTDGFVQIRLNL